MHIVAESKPPVNTLSEAWSELLDRYTWDFFCTLTYRCQDEVGPEKVRRDIRTWAGQWCKGTAIKRGLAKVIQRGSRERLIGHWARAKERKAREALAVYVAGIEPHRSGKLHAHVLWKSPAMLPRMSFKYGGKIWYDWHGWARIDKPGVIWKKELALNVGQSRALDYVSKYATKGGDVELSASFNAQPVVAELVGAPAA